MLGRDSLADRHNPIAGNQKVGGVVDGAVTVVDDDDGVGDQLGHARGVAP